MGKLLTTQRDVKFELGFKYKLERNYTIDNLEKRELKDFQRFLNKVAEMTVQDVDNKYLRKSDKTDTYRGQQILHYEVTDKFRLHVILEDGVFVIIRIDPNHKVHD